MPEQFTSGPEPVDAPPLPPPEGPLSEIVTRTIVRRTADHRDNSQLERAIATIDRGIDDPLDNLDLQLALDLCYELHYQSFRGVDPAWEWDPQLLEIRFQMESVLLDSLAVEVSKLPSLSSGSVPEQIRAMEIPGPVLRLTRFVELDCDLSQLRELLIHRSAERLKRPDACLWSVPRLQGRTRDALAQIENEELPRRSRLIRTLRCLGLDNRVGAYRDLLPAPTLASVNLSSLFGLRRQGRGAMAGHLAMLQILGTGDDRACALAMSRLGLGSEPGAFCEDSPESSRSLEQVAVEDLAGQLAADDPGLAGSILFGALALLATEARNAEWILDHWHRGERSLIEESLGFESGQGG